MQLSHSLHKNPLYFCLQHFDLFLFSVYSLQKIVPSSDLFFHQRVLVDPPAYVDSSSIFLSVFGRTAHGALCFSPSSAHGALRFFFFSYSSPANGSLGFFSLQVCPVFGTLGPVFGALVLLAMRSPAHGALDSPFPPAIGSLGSFSLHSGYARILQLSTYMQLRRNYNAICAHVFCQFCLVTCFWIFASSIGRVLEGIGYVGHAYFDCLPPRPSPRLLLLML